MNRIEKAEWAAGLRRRDAGREQACSWLGLPCPGPGGTATPAAGSRAGEGGHRSNGVEGAPQPRHSALSNLPFICWLCHFLPIADPFSVPSVISNNVTASLESIHQSRKKPMLTLIKKKKKKYHLCLLGKRSQPNLWRPRPPPPPACLPCVGVPRVIRFCRGWGALPQVVPPNSPAHSPRARGRWPLKEVLTPGDFPSTEDLDLAIWDF